MTVRDLKLAIATGIVSTEVKSLNKFFDNLFNDMAMYTLNDDPNIIYMNGTKFIMEHDFKKNTLWCRYNGFWKVLQNTYNCTQSEIREIIQYKVHEILNIESRIQLEGTGYLDDIMDGAFKKGSLTPFNYIRCGGVHMDNAYRIELLKPTKK